MKKKNEEETTTTTPTPPPPPSASGRVLSSSSSISSALLFATAFSAWAAFRYFLGGLALPASCKLFAFGCPPVLPSRGFVHAEHKYIEPLFHKIFVDGDDVGASFTAYVDGVKVAELYGGYTDKTYATPYSEDTLQLVFSASKMVTTFAVLSLLDRGHIPSLDAKVADYWPEFAEGGKENVTISQLLSHRAGLPFLDPERAPGVRELADLDALAKKIAGQPHAFGGEVRSAYHALAGGWFVNEFVRRADPKGRSIRYVVQEDILPIISSSTSNERPYEFYLGLTDSQYPALLPRLAPVIGLSPLQSLFHLLVPHSIQRALGAVPISTVMFDALLDPSSICAKAVFRSGPTFDPTWKQFPETYNNEFIWRSENPSFGGLTNARTLARLAAFMVNNGTLDGVTLFQPSTMRAALELQDARMDDVVKVYFAITKAGWGIFDTHFVNGTTFYGWSGSGGSIILWSYELNLAVSYVMNVGHFELIGDKRSRRIVEGIVNHLKSSKQDAKAAAPFYSHVVKLINGGDNEELNFESLQGKVTLIVNVASHCGYTRQYPGLEALHRKYASRGLTVLGFPCNQFGGQEPGSAAEIAAFCAKTYAVTFPIAEKIDVNGPAAHPLFVQLKGAAGGGDVRWNFEKFLVGRDGRVVERFGSRTTPEELDEKIAALL